MQLVCVLEKFIAHFYVALLKIESVHLGGWNARSGQVADLLAETTACVEKGGAGAEFLEQGRIHWELRESGGEESGLADTAVWEKGKGFVTLKWTSELEIPFVVGVRVRRGKMMVAAIAER